MSVTPEGAEGGSTATHPSPVDVVVLAEKRCTNVHRRG